MTSFFLYAREIVRNPRGSIVVIQLTRFCFFFFYENALGAVFSMNRRRVQEYMRLRNLFLPSCCFFFLSQIKVCYISIETPPQKKNISIETTCSV
jgi:hypothetical protein